MDDTFPISQKVLSWLEQTVCIQELPELIRQWFDSWKSQEAQPTYEQLKEFSKAARIPFGYLFRTDPPSEDWILEEFSASIESLPLAQDRELLDTTAKMKYIQAWMEEDRMDSDADPLPFIGCLKNEKNLSRIVQKARQLLGLQPEDRLRAEDSRTFLTVRSRIRSLGIMVMHNSPSETDSRFLQDGAWVTGFALTNRYVPLIFIHTGSINTENVFALLHGFIALLLGTSELFISESAQQTAASFRMNPAAAAAAELILPDSLFLKSWNGIQDCKNVAEKVKSPAGRFRCSSLFLAEKTLAHDLICEKEMFQISEEADTDIRKEKAGSAEEERSLQGSGLDPQFLSALYRSVQEGTESWAEAFRMTNISSGTFSAAVRKAVQEEQIWSGAELQTDLETGEQAAGLPQRMCRSSRQ